MYAAKFRSLERYSAHNRIETEGKGYDDDKDARKDVRWFVALVTNHVRWGNPLLRDETCY